ncbi:guanylate kinase [Geobacillus phage GR1]|nr:guanylate kinase [Geobacillus phage GR1]
MIYVLLGPTCSGKTTTLKQLIDIGYESIITYTTRPKRKNEVDGKDYYFISERQFEHLDESNLLVAKNTFKNAFGTEWHYAINRQDVDLTKDLVVITEPKGYRDLVKTFGKENVTSIYLNTNYEIRLVRGLNRRDQVNELFRRLLSDEEDFRGFEEEADHIITETTRVGVLDEVLKIIHGGRKS